MITVEFNFNKVENFEEESFSKEIIDLLKSIRFDFTEDTRGFRKYFYDHIYRLGWSDKYRISSEMSTTITSIKGDTGMCLQIGNIARIFYDLVKLEYLYKKKHIQYGIVICPIEQFGSNIAYFDRFVRESELYNNFFNIPLKVIGINN